VTHDSLIIKLPRSTVLSEGEPRLPLPNSECLGSTTPVTIADRHLHSSGNRLSRLFAPAPIAPLQEDLSAKPLIEDGRLFSTFPGLGQVCMESVSLESDYMGSEFRSRRMLSESLSFLPFLPPDAPRGALRGPVSLSPSPFGGVPIAVALRCPPQPDLFPYPRPDATIDCLSVLGIGAS